MFEPDLALIEQVVDKLEGDFRSTCPDGSPEQAAALADAARDALGRVAGCDALYHNLHHTVLVTLVAVDILKGKNKLEETVEAQRWLSFVVAAMCHDIGFVPGICSEDRDGFLATGTPGETFSLPHDRTDASMAPHHVERSALYAREMFADHPLLDGEAIATNVERTLFPVPDDEAYQATDDDPGLLRAADLLGQVAGRHVARRYPALFYEFEETGVNERLGFTSPHDLRQDFPRFYSKVIVPYSSAAMRLLEATGDGQMWLANLHAHLAEIEGGTLDG